VPLAPAFLEILREETRKKGALLIFDEVVTGFRVSPGGAQRAYNVIPDLTALAKILAGGLPGGAVAGRQDIMEELDFRVTEAKQREKIAHPGTYNGNPVSAAAGVAALGIVGTTDACERANAFAATLRGRFNAELARAGVPWAAYGTFSGFHVYLNSKQRPLDPEHFDPLELDYRDLSTHTKPLARKVRLAMLVNGVDINGRLGGFASATHGPGELEHTVGAFRSALEMLREEGELPARRA
jgi:glutamate-1-semialdehyde 2,1-aminomutase